MTQQPEPWGSGGYVPEHVPAKLVRAFDFAEGEGMSKCPFSATSRLHGGERIFWNSANRQFGGTWVPTRAEDIRFILTHTDIFSNKGETGFSAMLGESWDMTPLELDPPLHTKFRQLLNPLLAPPAVAKLTPNVTARAVALIEAVRERGECEFMTAFGRSFPVGVFMELMGLPAEHTELLLGYEYELLHAPELDRKLVAAASIRDYLRALADKRRADPTSDLTSFVVTARIDGRPLTDDEVMGTLYLFFVGGLDTVASSLGFFFRHLAEHPELQNELRSNPHKIERAVEELLRRFSVVTAHRQCKVDVEVGGVQMKAGDWVTINGALASLDPDEFESPLDLNFDRRAIRHLGFSFGPHFCMGSHLARRELIIALREWLARVPTWWLKPGSTVEVHGGVVFGVEHLEIEWDA